MIKIRYRDPNDLSPGLHASAEGHGRRTTVYLLSGLTAPERRRALRRLRLNARMGYCPRLPASQLALALLADRFRTGLARAGAVFRVHPAGSALPVMFISGGAIAFLLFSTVSIHVLHPPRNSKQLPASGPAPAASADAVPFPGASQAAGLGRPPGASSDTGEVTAAQSRSRAAGANLAGTGTGGNADSGTGTGGTTTTGTSSQPGTNTTDPAPSTTTQGSTTRGQSPGGQSSGSQNSSGQSSSSQGAGQSSGQSSGGQSSSSQSSGGQSSSGQSSSGQSSGGQSTSPSGSSSSSSSSSTSSSGSGGGLCLDVGPLGVCLNV
jgi:hypothetical protein